MRRLHRCYLLYRLTECAVLCEARDWRLEPQESPLSDRGLFQGRVYSGSPERESAAAVTGEAVPDAESLGLRLSLALGSRRCNRLQEGQARLVMGRLKKTGSRLDLPSGPAKWRQLEVDDAFFTGADVGGFLGLEELAPPSAKAVVQERPAKRQKVKGPSQNDGPMVLAGSDAAAAPSETASQPAVTPTAQTQTQASTEIPAPAQKKPARKGKKRVADTASGGKNKVKESSDSNSQESPSTQAPEEEDTDISTTDREAVKAWDFSGLHPQLLKSLARLGFTHPTPIQQRCLPTAIWDGRDIVGAAQTVCSSTAPLDTHGCNPALVWVLILGAHARRSFLLGSAGELTLGKRTCPA